MHYHMYIWYKMHIPGHVNLTRVYSLVPLHAGVCAGKLAPAVPPKHSGNQAFIYHPRVAEVFRAKMLAPWFVEYAARHNKTLDRDEFVSNLAALQVCMGPVCGM